MFKSLLLKKLQDMAQVCLLETGHLSVSKVTSLNESPSSHEIEWDFNGPLLNGPLPSDITFDNSSPIVFKTTERHKLVQQNYTLWQRRDELLSIAESHIDCTNAPGFRAMALYSERVFKYQLDHLDAALVAYPVQLSEDEVGYCFDLRKYGSVIDCMEKIAIKCSGVLERFSLPAPSIPSLPKEWTSDSLWSLQDIEMLCIMLREDVENFISFYWDLVSKEKGNYRPSDDNMSSPVFPPPPLSNMEQFTKCYAAAHEAYHRKCLAEQLFNGAIPSPTKRVEVRDVPPHLSVQGKTKEDHHPYVPHSVQLNPDQDGPIDHSFIKHRQSAAYNRGPRLSALSNSPYHRLPTKLTSSEGLKEMFGSTRESRHSRRATMFNIPETPYQTVSTPANVESSAGAPPGDDDPSDDNDSDVPSSPTLNVPRPRKSFPPHGDNYPGQGGGGGGPPSGDPHGTSGAEVDPDRGGSQKDFTC
ncbi:hypothetical protein K439DRAFT_1612567 [Ramaria rubella]|nr:hypothetical protein K439DRAFT_1612567 [Ramaria rubella]